MLGEGAGTLFVTSGRVAFLHDADALRVAAYLVLVLSFGLIVRRSASGDDTRASVLDGAIVGCALFAACWPTLAYPSVMSRAAEVSGGWLDTARPLLAIVMCAVGVRLLFRTEVASRLLFFAVVPLAFADLFEGAGFTHSTGSGRGVVEASALFAFSMIAIAARRGDTGEAQLVDIDPADRIRVLCILTAVALCSAIPVSDAWSAGHRDASTLVPGACAIVLFVLVALRLWHLAASARVAGVRHGLRRLGALVQVLNDAIFVIDRAGVISYASPRARTLLCSAADELVGRRFDESLGLDESERVVRQLGAAVALPLGTHQELIGIFVDAEGRPRDFEMSVVNMLGDRDVAGLVVTMRDVTTKRELARELEQRVFRDDLTNLANRSLFMDRLDQARLRSRRSHSGIAVMFVDLDDFKAVNDGLGHAAGDTLLCAVSGRLSECLRPSDTIARLGGDEFAVLLDGVADVAEVMNVAQRLLEVLQLPVEIGELSVTVPASIGIAIAEEGYAHSNLIRDADIALYARSKGERTASRSSTRRWGGRRTRACDCAHNSNRPSRHNEPRVLFQPIIRSGRARSSASRLSFGGNTPSSARSRRRSSSRSPRRARSSPLSVGGCCRRHARTPRSGTACNRSLYVSVNVSARQLREPGSPPRSRRRSSRRASSPRSSCWSSPNRVLIDEVAGPNLVTTSRRSGRNRDRRLRYRLFVPCISPTVPGGRREDRPSFVSRMNEDGMRARS